ncbi:hypothetical protein ACLOJK_026781 [Asimina triloba]
MDHNLPRLLLKAPSRIIDSLDEKKPPAKVAIEIQDIKGDNAVGSTKTRKEGTKEETRYQSKDVVTTPICMSGAVTRPNSKMRRLDKN